MCGSNGRFKQSGDSGLLPERDCEGHRASYPATHKASGTTRQDRMRHAASAKLRGRCMTPFYGLRELSCP
jgi:hypothetical protein